MSDMWIVVIGVVSVLSALAIVTFAARPSEFRSKPIVVQPPVQWIIASAQPAPSPQSTPVAAVQPSHIPARPDPAPPVVPALEASGQSLEYLKRPAVRTIKRGASDQALAWAKPPARTTSSPAHGEPTGRVEPRETLPI
jgi:hypothetical protein